VKRLAALFMVLALVTGAGAQVRPQAGPGDPRLQSVEYRPEQVVLLEVAPGYQLTLELAPDERIENVAMGDSGAWQATANRRGDRLFVKALRGGVSTNLTIITDIRHYAIELAPLYGPSPDMAYIVRFEYPQPAEDESEVETAVAGRYRISGARSLRPTRMGDDGRHTYIEWPAAAPLPAVYAVAADGSESLINGAMRGDMFVLDSVERRLAFRIDRRVAHAERKSNRP